MTNGDRIRQMTDRQLAKSGLIDIRCDECPFRDKKGCCGGDCIKAIEKWLKKEVKDDAEH